MSIFLPSLKKSGRLDQMHITICNIGSRKVSEQDDYSSLGWNIFAPNLTIYGFDADADACNAANADIEARQVNWTEKHIPIALGKSVGEAPLYVTNSLACVSLYPPNKSYVSRFSGLLESMDLCFTMNVETTTLDTFCQTEGIHEIDFLQIDVQGAELDVFEGASALFERSVLAIQTEVEFSHLYVGQPLFADVDIYLRKQGFTLFDLMVESRPRTRATISSKLHQDQLLWGDAFYMRDLLREDIEMNLKTSEQIFKLACIADVLHFPGYALELLEYLTINYSHNPNYNFANNIVETLTQFPELVEQGLDSLPVIQNIREYIQ